MPDIKARTALAVCGGAALLGGLASGPAVRAQPARPMTLVDIAELPRALDPQLSPDGQSVVYLLSHADWKLDRPVWHLWRQDIGGGAPRRLTFGEAGEIPGGTRWAPDGRTILFTRDGQLFLLPVDGGEARQLTHHATGVSAPTWTPDGQAVYFLASDPPTGEERERDRLRDDVFAFDETTFRQRHLWKVIGSTGIEQPITSGGSSVLSYRLSRDGRHIAFARGPTPLVADAPRSEVWTMDADGQNARALTRNDVEESDPELSPDNSQVLFLADANAQLEPYYNTNLFVVPANGGTPTPVLRDAAFAFDRATWAPDGRSILAVVNLGVHSEIFLIDVASRRPRQLTDGRHSIPPAPAPAWAFEPGAGRVVFQVDEPTRFGEVWMLSLDNPRPARVTHVFDALAREFALPRQEKVAWKGADGATVEGLLFFPIEYQPGQRYPLVVQMHGGPAESDKFGAGAGLLQNYFPVLAARGYAVLRPNYRGSAGYGNPSYRDVVGGYFRNQQLDVMAGIDFLIRQGIADPARLVAMGWSAGGHLTNKLITMTDRFKAASSGAGVANWISMYAQTDTRASRTLWFGGTPWQRDPPITTYWHQSPVKDAATVKTPTLFFVGENDARVPMAQAQEMYRALVSNRVPTRLYVAPREAHQWSGLHHLLFKANAELEWFERYARGRAYPWETAPSSFDASAAGARVDVK